MSSAAKHLHSVELYIVLIGNLRKPSEILNIYCLFRQQTNLSFYLWRAFKKYIFAQELCFYSLNSLYSHQSRGLISEGKQKSTEIIEWDNISQSNIPSSFMNTIYLYHAGFICKMLLISNHETHKWMIFSFCYLGIQLDISNGNVRTLLQLVVLDAPSHCSIFFPPGVINKYLTVQTKFIWSHSVLF